MPDRIANLASSTQLLNYLKISQNRLRDLQYQVTSEKVSPDYRGISKKAQYLLKLENSRDQIAGYMQNNEVMSTRLDIASTVMDGVETTVNDFKKTLVSFNSQASSTEASIKDIQDAAQRALLSMEAYLNTSVAGRYIFSGARTETKPVELNASSLTTFQSRYDGATVTYPTTRDMHLENFSIDRDSTGATNWLTFAQDDDGNAATSGVSSITATTAQFSNVTVGSTIEVSGTASNDGFYTVKAITGGGTTIQVETRMLTVEANNAAAVITKPDGSQLSSADFTDLSFDRATDRITVGAASLGTNALSDLTVGSTFTVSGTAQNDGTYTVAAVAANGDTVDIVPKKMTTVGAATTGTVSSITYYSGDQLTTTHRVDEARSFEFDLNAVDPAFEKAIRAMGIIAQGTYGTEGGLDQNLDRVGDAIYLLENAIDGTSSSTAPYGTELSSNIKDLLVSNGFNKVLISQSTETHVTFTGFLEGQIADIENTDPLETLTRLLDDQNSLEASYQTLARIRDLSLVKFM